MSLFKGISTALVTPFDQKNHIDYTALESMIARQIEAGVAGLVICGTTGEPVTLLEEERKELLSFVVEQTGGRIPVIAGVCGNNTLKAAKEAASAAEIGVNGILAVTPYYNKATQKGMIAHFTEIANAAQLPVILYNVPSRTGLNLLPETAAELAQKPYIDGIKEASGNVAQAVTVRSICPDSFALYSGNDEIIVPLLSIGGSGAISVLANIAPELCVRMYQLFDEGQYREAGKLQIVVKPLIDALFAEVNPIPVKAAAKLLGICEDVVRAPLTVAEENTVFRLIKEMKRLGLI